MTAPEPLPCKHIWKIEPASGPTSHGVCTRCGDENDFENSIAEVESDKKPRKSGLAFIHRSGSEHK